MLTDEDKLISFCTYAEKDDIQPTERTPWIGFVYTFPKYRGHRYVGYLFQEIETLAKADNINEIFISTNHTGLYEKYGCEFYQMMKDMGGEPSRVYIESILIRAHRQHLYKYFRRLLHRMHKAEGQIEILSGAEHSVMCPDCHILLLHKLAGRCCDVTVSRNHPAYDADPGRKYNRTFGSHLPQLSYSFRTENSV